MRNGQKKIYHALIISDIHLGWAACSNIHARLLNNLYKIADDAELIILNGDIIDHLRKAFGRRSKGLIRKAYDLVREWRASGRKVVYIEGNHDRAGIAAHEFIPEYPFYEFTGTDGEKIVVFHGHEEMSPRISEYDGIGSALLTADNYAFARIPLLRPFLRYIGCRFYGFVAYCEVLIWHDRIRKHLVQFRPEADIVVHGHMHFGPFHYTVNGRPVYRSGSWVSEGQTGVTTGLLRYVRGRFERLDLVGEEWVACPFTAK